MYREPDRSHHRPCERCRELVDPSSAWTSAEGLRICEACVEPARVETVARRAQEDSNARLALTLVGIAVLLAGTCALSATLH